MGVLSEFGANLIPISPDQCSRLWWILREPPPGLWTEQAKHTYFFRGDNRVFAERVEVAAAETGPMLIGLEGTYFPYIELYAAQAPASAEDMDVKVQGTGLQAWFAPAASPELIEALLKLTCQKYLKCFQFSLNSRTMRLYDGDPKFLCEYSYYDYRLEFMDELALRERLQGEA